MNRRREQVTITEPGHCTLQREAVIAHRERRSVVAGAFHGFILEFLRRLILGQNRTRKKIDPVAGMFPRSHLFNGYLRVIVIPAGALSLVDHRPGSDSHEHEQGIPGSVGSVGAGGVLGVVVMRPISVEKEVVSTHLSYAAPIYRGYWGAYYGAGWGTPWGVPQTGEFPTNTIVQVETLVYSSIDRTIERFATAAAEELHKQGLLR